MSGRLIKKESSVVGSQSSLSGMTVEWDNVK